VSSGWRQVWSARTPALDLKTGSACTRLEWFSCIVVDCVTMLLSGFVHVLYLNAEGSKLQVHSFQRDCRRLEWGGWHSSCLGPPRVLYKPCLLQQPNNVGPVLIVSAASCLSCLPVNCNKVSHMCWCAGDPFAFVLMNQPACMVGLPGFGATHPWALQQTHTQSCSLQHVPFGGRMQAAIDCCLFEQVCSADPLSKGFNVRLFHGD